VPCWIKGDPAFASFQQIKTDPQERVFIGDVPPALARVEANKTKYFTEVSFNRVAGSDLNEDWFSGTVPLNPGLIAIIGNKGSGKTALAETIGLLADSGQSEYFTFLSSQKFRQQRNNKAKHFRAKLRWASGHEPSKSLADDVSEDAVESVCYIPQHYLEIICNELRFTSDSKFEQELKSVIYSHVPNAERLGAESLDELLKFRTEQIHERRNQLREELSTINSQILGLQNKVGPRNKQLLLNLLDQKTRELEAHENTKPAEVKQPTLDAAAQSEMQTLSVKISDLQAEKAELQNRVSIFQQDEKDARRTAAVAKRVLARTNNFVSQYQSFRAENEADSAELAVPTDDLVHVTVSTEILDEIVTAKDNDALAAISSIQGARGELTSTEKAIEQLKSELDEPNRLFQSYLQALDAWQRKKRADHRDSGSARFVNLYQR
jgi:hypothetical protein